MKVKRVLIKFSGETLKGDKEHGIDEAMLLVLSEQIKSVVSHGYQVGIVIGGGNIYRGIQGAAKGFDRVMGDYVGMLATVFNSIFISETLRSLGLKVRVLSGLSVPQVVEDFHPIRARKYLEDGEVLVFGGGTGNPYFTTDTAAALRAVEIDADLLIKCTKVDGVYSDDPVKNPDAVRLDQIAYDDYLQQHLKVMDSTAVSLCRDNQLPILVTRFDLHAQSDLLVCLDGTRSGTIIGGNEL